MPLLALVCLVALWLAPGRALASPGLALAPRAGAAAAGAPGARDQVAARWVAPVDPVVVRRAFAPPAARWGAGHRGADLASRPGAPVRAAGGGRVTFAGVLAGRGVVVVTHGALRTTYEPVRALLPAGTAVSPGTAVATLAGGHAGPARDGEALLHWGLLRGDRYLDPLSLLRRGPSRLLPVAPAPPAPDLPVAPAPPAPDLPVALPAARGVAVPPPDSGRPGAPVSPRASAVAAAAAALAGAVTVTRRRRRPPRSRGSP